MSNSKKNILYILFTIVAGILFIYLLFPDEKVKDYMAFQLNRAYPDLRMSIDGVRLDFPPGIRLNGVSLQYSNSEMLRIERARITPKLLSLLRKRPFYVFSGRTLDGEFGGKAAVLNDKKGRRFEIEGDFKDLQISRIPALQNLGQRRIAGRLAGNMMYKGAGSAGTTRLNVTLSNGEFELSTPIPDLDSVTFDTLKADMVLTGERLQVKTCEITGQQIEGSLSGTIRLKKPFKEGTLHLRGRLKPQPEFLSDIKKIIPEALLPKKLTGRNGFPITLNGTLERPGFLLR